MLPAAGQFRLLRTCDVSQVQTQGKSEEKSFLWVSGGIDVHSLTILTLVSFLLISRTVSSDLL